MNAQKEKKVVSKKIVKKKESKNAKNDPEPAKGGDDWKRFQKKEEIQHILDRPDTFIGSNEYADYDKTTNYFFLKDGKIEIQKKMKFIPGLYKIFDECLVNAADNVVKTHNNPNMLATTYIKIDLYKDRFAVENDGEPIPIQMHEEEGMYVPELIFGHLRTSDNYDDSKERFTGGRNGYGSKLAVIFSTKTNIKIVDNQRKKSFTQTIKNNMRDKETPVVEKCNDPSMVRIECFPDFKRFENTEEFSDDMINYLTRRAYDVAATTPSDVKVYINDKLIEISDFLSYVKMYEPGVKDEDILYTKPNALIKKGEDDKGNSIWKKTNKTMWEIAFVKTIYDYRQVSFVNNINTFKGGKHVNYVTGKIKSYIFDKIKKKKPNAKKDFIDNYIHIYINCMIDKPKFGSQSKETMITQITKFGSKFEFDKEFLKSIEDTGIIEDVLKFADFKEEQGAKKNDGKKSVRLKALEKLHDAPNAGKKNLSSKCVLILTEGLSAAGLALKGLSPEQRKFYGIYPLRGKVLNVRDEPISRILKNAEINDIKSILGLSQGQVIEDTSSLRYGSILYMTDQDSVTGDTSLLLKNTDGYTEIKTIDELTYKWESYGNKERGTCNYMVWTEKGWTKIKQVIRHKTDKDIYRVLTHTGVVHCTEDHSLVDKNGNKISPKECKVGTELLHSFPYFEEDFNTKDLYSILSKYSLCRIADKLNIDKDQPLQSIVNNLHDTDILDNLECIGVTDLIKLARKLNIQQLTIEGKFANKERVFEMVKDKLTSFKNSKLDEYSNNSYEQSNITEEQAYMYGLFYAEGSCGVYKWFYKAQNKDRISYSWAISNNDLSLLEKTKKICDKLYPNNIFKIIESRHDSENHGYDMSYKLNLNGGRKAENIIRHFRNIFYHHSKMKKVPMEILNAPNNIKKSFLDGLYDGDGHRSVLKKNNMGICVQGQIGAMGIFYLYKSLGYRVSINTRTDKPTVYTLRMTKKSQQCNTNAIKKIYKIESDNQYVYDLETENHHFHAGVGQMIVHNTDGFHIKGLLMNLFDTMWDSLYQFHNFFGSIRTPILKARQGKNTRSFYTEAEHKKWKESLDPKEYKKWSIKYYKGLGTSKDSEAIEYFSNLDKNVVYYNCSSEERNDAKEKLDMIFNSKRAKDRKAWLDTYNEDLEITYNKNNSTDYETFFDNEFIHFSNYDNIRSIPSLHDGLKVSQRKILYGVIKKNLKKEMKVSVLGGAITEITHYHHGEVSMYDTIVKMAQIFVGSNNINYLEPEGQFGSRIYGGSDAAAARYIETKLNTLVTKIFKTEDNPILTYTTNDNEKTEPETYYPIIPMILVNGAKGIGTGYSTSVPSYNPIELVNCIKAKLNQKEYTDISPWYAGFNGCVNKEDSHKKIVDIDEEGNRHIRVIETPPSYTTTGKYKMDGDKIYISEIPVGLWVVNYKKHLDSLVIEKNAKAKNKAEQAIIDKQFILNYEEICTDFGIDITIYTEWSKLQEYILKGTLEKVLKLESKVGTTNMVLFNSNKKLIKYKYVSQILDEFVDVRYKKYEERIDYQIKELNKHLVRVNEKIRFLIYVMEEKIIVFKKSNEEVSKQLEAKKFKKIDESYDYLLSMPIGSFTKEKLDKLNKEKDDTENKIKSLESTTVKEVWFQELDEFVDEYEKYKKRREKFIQMCIDRDRKRAKKGNDKKLAIKLKKKK